MVSRRAVICAGICGLTGACLASMLWGLGEASAMAKTLDDTPELAAEKSAANEGDVPVREVVG